MTEEPRLKPIRLDSYKPLRETVSDTLRQAIQDGILRPGERLMEIPLAQELGVSRTPIREAIRKLELEGYVMMIPRRGTYVSTMSLKDIYQVYEIRLALEELAASLAAERITAEELESLERLLVEVGEYIEKKDIDRILDADVTFHDILYKASRNERLAEIVGNLREQIARFRALSMNRPGRLKQTWEEHRLLVEAIADHDGEEAGRLARRHLELAEQAVLAEMEKLEA